MPRAAARSPALGAVGAVIAVAALAAVVATLADHGDELRDAIDGASVAWLVLAWALAGVAMAAIALPWRHAITALGGPMLPRRESLPRFFLGEIGKYLPGAVWPVVGRGELAVRAGVSRSVAYGSVALSLLGLYAAAAAVVVGSLPWSLDDARLAGLAGALLLACGVALHPRVLGAALALVERMAGRRLSLEVPPLDRSLRLVARYLPAWAAVGAATWCVARALDPSAPVVEIVAAAALSWIVGFLAVPVPGGVGVREAAFALAATSVLDPGVAAATALVVRTLLMSVDAGGAVLAAVFLRRRTQVVTLAK